MNAIERFKKPSPEFFKKITNICIVIGAVGGALLTSPVVLPVGLVTVGGYLVTVGTVGGIISKLTVKDNPETEDKK